MIGTRVAWSVRYPGALDVLTLKGQRFLVQLHADGWQKREPLIPSFPRRVKGTGDGPRDAWAFLSEGAALVHARLAGIPDHEVDDADDLARNPR